MANYDWETRARQFLTVEARKLQVARGEAELRTSVMDTHSALEDVLRGYLSTEYDIEGLGNKSEWNFPSVVDLLREKTGNRVINPDAYKRIMCFNGLRNRVVHERYIPTIAEVQDGISITDGVLHNLLSGNQTAPEWKIPYQNIANSIARSIGSDLSFGLGGIMIIFAILYFLNPVDLPGPLDDAAIGGTCIFSALLLFQAANALRNNSSRRKNKQ